MAKSRTELCMELLAGGDEALSDEELAAACGLRVESVRRLRRDEGFIGETNRLAKRRFVAELPRVLRALTEAACAGGNASAMKLFLDVCLGLEPAGGVDEELEGMDLRELVERARDAGVWPPAAEGKKA